MTKTKLIFVGLAVALVGFLFAGSASAQGPSISLDPATVSDAGEVTVAVTGSGWTVATANVLTCNVPAGGNAAEINVATHCTLPSGNLNLGGVVPAPVSGGGFEASITVDVPEQGIIIIAGDTGQTESASEVLAVSMMDDMDDMDDMLPATGVNTSVLVIIGVGIALAGVMVFGLSRRLRSL